MQAGTRMIVQGVPGVSLAGPFMGSMAELCAAPAVEWKPLDLAFIKLIFNPIGHVGQ